ncbi:uncharacterized protein ACRADG_009810 isoform 1-T3 [Cochliomyia hominivorax]
MMTCDKQNENFITQQMQSSEAKKDKILKNNSNTIISHSNNNSSNSKSVSKNNKFNKTTNLTNNQMIMVKLSTTKVQAHTQTKLQQRTNNKCIMKQRQQQQQREQKQTIITKVLKPEIPTMSQQQQKHTHMTLKEYFEISNDVSETTTTTTAASGAQEGNLRINKTMNSKQKEQDINKNGSTFNSGNKYQQKQRPTFANLTDPVDTRSDLTTTTSTSFTTTRHLPPLSASMRASLTIPVTQDIQKKSQSKIQQHYNNVCISSKCGSKQKCAQQHQEHCKSANLSSCNRNINGRTCSKTNINTHITKGNTDTIPVAIAAAKESSTTVATVASSSVEDITNTNIINTTTSNTKKANISINTITTTNNATHTNNITASPTNNSRPTELSTPAAAALTLATTTATYCKAFSLRQHFSQNMKHLDCLLRTLVFSFMFVMSMQYQTVSASTSMMSKPEPMFISRSETFKFVASDTIVLPCEVANTDSYVVAWKRGIAILTAGSVKVTPDPRVRLVNGFNLQIRDAVPQDAGDYICQIATMEPREITHTVEILVPPRIHHISTSGHLQVKKGSSVRIECSASGNPTPNVTWSRKNNILPNGEEKLHSHILSIENVDRHKGGVYICTANNGVGQPASSQVVLHVLYPPEITVERPVVFSGEGHEAMLVCIVHGETQPEVIWFKDTMQLDTTERHIMENRGSRHTLIIRKVHPQDFGNYSCVAENQLGKSRKTLQLSGKPNVAVFNSPPISQYKDRYNISWTVESHTPIEEYKLSFRRLQQGQEVDNSIDSHSSSSSSMLQMYGGGSMSGSMMGVNAHNYRLGGISSMNGMGSSGGYGSYGSANVIHWGRNDWRDVVLPAIPTSHHYTQGMSYMIRGLDPDQHYEATVQARNRYGWSDYSQSFVFSTSSNDNEMRDLSVTFYGSKSSRIEALSFLLLLITAGSLCVINFNY